MIAQGIGQVTGRLIMKQRMVNDGGSSRVLKMQMKSLIAVIALDFATRLLPQTRESNAN